jgi:hypothetical protein
VFLKIKHLVFQSQSYPFESAMPFSIFYFTNNNGIDAINIYFARKLRVVRETMTCKILTCNGGFSLSRLAFF